MGGSTAWAPGAVSQTSLGSRLWVTGSALSRAVYIGDNSNTVLGISRTEART
jgi:hypothetical protein